MRKEEMITMKLKCNFMYVMYKTDMGSKASYPFLPRLHRLVPSCLKNGGQI